VLFVDHSSVLGGGEHSLLLLLGSLDRRRFVPHLAAPPGELASAAELSGIRVHRTKLSRLRREPAALRRLGVGARRIAGIVRREDVAVVYGNTLRGSLYAAVAARLTGVPFLWHVRDILPRAWHVRALAAMSKAVVAVSKAAADALPRPDGVRVIYNGVRLADFPQREERRPAAGDDLRAAWGVPSEAVLAGHVARLQPWKGQRDFIEAAGIVARAATPVRFVLVGGDVFNDASDYERELRALVKERGLGNLITFAGHQRDMRAVFAALDIAVSASDREPFGRGLLEAAASGLPIVAYANGGTPEMLSNGESAVLVPAGDPAALACGILELATKPEVASELGRKARLTVADRFDHLTTTLLIEGVLEEVIQTWRRACRDTSLSVSRPPRAKEHQTRQRSSARSP
jgi:glycosyltransferase involved in cell wall biosynthesis